MELNKLCETNQNEKMGQAIWNEGSSIFLYLFLKYYRSRFDSAIFNKSSVIDVCPCGKMNPRFRVHGLWKMNLVVLRSGVFIKPILS